ncbi:MAG TPA: lipid-A-disaccharide synthase [Candidatus Acidoferrales bacterium]|nr:lipid-A-disaccharide synthase [Candidatus Acidoferrales bacterium]
MSKTCMIIAGEISGDKHAARVVERMKRERDLRVIGIGGDRMKAAGVELLYHVKEMSVMGFGEIISKLPFFRKVRRDLSRVIAEEKPSAVILVDYPGFNLRFAELAKRKGLKVVYFISPQIWAWGKGRIKKIRRTVDLMLTIFKFEEEMYKKENVTAHFIGHPLVDEMKIPRAGEVENFREKYSSALSAVNKRRKFLALLPGSRMQEIKRILPTMLESVKVLKMELADDGIELETIIGCAPGVEDETYHKIVEQSGFNAHLCLEVELLMSSADAGMVTSGTATLEAALHNLPIVVVYKTSFATYFIGRLLVRLKSISLVNIVAQQEIVHELVQYGFKPPMAAAFVKEILTDNQAVDEIRRKYAELKNIIGGEGACDRAAELILKMI